MHERRAGAFHNLRQHAFARLLRRRAQGNLRAIACDRRFLDRGRVFRHHNERIDAAHPRR